MQHKLAYMTANTTQDAITLDELAKQGWRLVTVSGGMAYMARAKA